MYIYTYIYMDNTETTHAYRYRAPSRGALKDPMNKSLACPSINQLID